MTNELYYLLLSAILTIPVFFISYVKTGKVYNFISLIAGWYLFWCLISCTEICNYVIEFDNGRIYIISNILVLLYASCITIKNYPLKVLKTQGDNEHRKSIKQESSVVKVLRNAVLAFEIIFLTTIIINIAQGRLSIFSIRTVAYSNGENALFSSAMSDIYYVFVKGFVIFDVISELIQITNGKRKPNVISIVNLVLFCMITLNRIELVRTVIIYVICMSISGKSITAVINQSKMVKRIVRVLIVGILLLVVIRFVVRDSKEGLVQSVVNTIFEDFSISYVTFNRFWVQYLEGYRPVDCTIFDILFGGPIKILQPILSLFGVKVINYNGILAERLDYAIDVGRLLTLKTNAFYTMYYNFVNGGGIVIPYIVSASFGAILGLLYNAWRRKNCTRNFALVVYCIHIVIMGLLRWEMYAYWAWVTLFLLIVFLGKKKIRFVVGNKLRRQSI